MMITRCYADNYRCFSNFEQVFEGLTVLMGPNGAGKSTVVSLLAKLRDFILGKEDSVTLFPNESLTRWDKRVEQTFEIEMKLEEGLYRYRLRLTHSPDQGLNKIVEETVTLDLKPLFSTDTERTTLFNDSFAGGVQLMPDWRISGVSRVRERHDNRKLIAFRRALEKTLILALNPALVSAVSSNKQPVTIPELDCSDFADWLKYVSASEVIARRNAEDSLAKGGLPGFQLFETKPSGDASILNCLFSSGSSKNVRFRLDELSAGQIALVILETAIAVAIDQKGTLILDEPGNFLGLGEVQPLIVRLQDAAGEEQCQVILTAHHPMAIDSLAGAYGYWLEREAVGHTRGQKIKISGESDGDLRLSDLVARGWLSGLGVEATNSIGSL